jgi:hypothetical protein
MRVSRHPNKTARHDGGQDVPIEDCFATRQQLR